MKRRLGAIVAAAGAVLSAAPAMAIVWGTAVTDPDELTGVLTTRSVSGAPGGLTSVGGGPQDLTDFAIGWNVTFDGGTNLWTYEYSIISGPPPGISHLWLEITNPSTVTVDDVNGNKIDAPQIYSGGNGNSDPGWPTYNDGNDDLGIPIYGFKFDYEADLGDTYVLTTPNAPVWGNFFGTGGGSSVYNLGFESFDGTTFTDTNTGNFIVRPNGAHSGDDDDDDSTPPGDDDDDDNNPPPPGDDDDDDFFPDDDDDVIDPDDDDDDVVIDDDDDDSSPPPPGTPEPATLGLAVLAAMGLVYAGRRRRA